MAVAVLASGNTVASATPTDRTLADIKSAGAAATTARISSLGNAITKVQQNEYLTDAHRGAILTTLNADLAAMRTLQAKIAADTEVATAKTDYRSIFTDYRVYAVALPQSFDACAADGLTDSALPRLQKAHDALAAALAGSGAGRSTPELQAELTDMQNRIDDATHVIAGVADAALGVTPAGWNANHLVLAPYRQAVSTALADAKYARADGQAIVAALK